MSRKALRRRLEEAGRRLRSDLGYYRRLAGHPRTPAWSKALLALAVGYVLLPFDLIPDFLPVVGHLDDAVVVPLLVVLALRGVPRAIREECRRP